MMRRTASALTAAILLAMAAAPAFAQFDEVACKPYKHGELREQTPTMFCEKKADALAYIELMEKRRTEQISLEDGRKALAEFRKTRECIYAFTSHVSRQTLHKASEAAPYCRKAGFDATKWPSLVEAELSEDGTKIWVITHAVVPPVEK